MVCAPRSAVNRGQVDSCASDCCCGQTWTRKWIANEEHGDVELRYRDRDDRQTLFVNSDVDLVQRRKRSVLVTREYHV